MDESRHGRLQLSEALDIVESEAYTKLLGMARDEGDTKTYL